MQHHKKNSYQTKKKTKCANGWDDRDKDPKPRGRK